MCSGKRCETEEDVQQDGDWLLVERYLPNLSESEGAFKVGLHDSETRSGLVDGETTHT